MHSANIGLFGSSQFLIFIHSLSLSILYRSTLAHLTFEWSPASFTLLCNTQYLSLDLFVSVLSAINCELSFDLLTLRRLVTQLLLCLCDNGLKFNYPLTSVVECLLFNHAVMNFPSTNNTEFLCILTVLIVERSTIFFDEIHMFCNLCSCFFTQKFKVLIQNSGAKLSSFFWLLSIIRIRCSLILVQSMSIFSNNFI